MGCFYFDEIGLLVFLRGVIWGKDGGEARVRLKI